MKIKFLQVAIAQKELNRKYDEFYHCSIGVNLETNELTRLYPVGVNAMRKNHVYEITVEPMTCRRENSYRPIKITWIKEIHRNQTTGILNRIPLTTIDKLNTIHHSMGVVDVSEKRLFVHTNEHEVHATQYSLFENEFSTVKVAPTNYAEQVHKDIRIRFKDNDTKQQYREISYHENHFFVGLEKNGVLPVYYDSNEWNRLIVGNLRNHRSTFIGLCLFKNLKQ
jgi:hypothetical protein